MSLSIGIHWLRLPSIQSKAQLADDCPHSNINNMERPIPVLQQRVNSFNPEAATFSPSSVAPIVHENTLHSPTTADIPHSTTAPMFQREILLELRIYADLTLKI